MRFKEKEMVNKMSSAAKYCERNVKIFKYKVLSFLKKGYFVKIDDNNFLLFEKERHYLYIIYLERRLIDLFEIIKFEKEEKEIKVSLRLASIIKYIEKLSKILFGSFYVNLWYMKKFRCLYEHENNILEDLIKWEDLEEIQDSLALEENHIIQRSHGCSGFEDPAYDDEYIERIRDIGYEMEALSLERKRRYEILRDNFFDLNRKIKNLINIKRFKLEI